MIILPLLSLQVTNLFDQCAATHLAMKRARVVVSAYSKGAKVASGRVELSFITPDRVRFRVSNAAAGHTAASERMYTLMGGKLYGFDLKANEWLERSAITKGSLAARVGSALGTLDASANYLIDPASLKTFLMRMKAIPGWSLQKNSVEETAHTTLAKVGEYTVRFSAKDHRLLGIDIRNGKTTTGWTYEYEADPISITFAPPKGATKVAVFRERQKSPTFASGQAKAVFQGSVMAYRRLKSASYTAIDGSGSWKVSYGATTASQVFGPTSFSFSGGSLKYSKGGAAKTVKTSVRTLPETLAKLKLSLEPMLRTLIEGTNPLERLVAEDLRIRYVGSVKAGANRYDVIEASKPGYRMTLELRSDNHLIASVVSEQIDARGTAFARTERRFTYR
jgi:hypothetical protein